MFWDKKERKTVSLSNQMSEQVNTLQLSSPDKENEGSILGNTEDQSLLQKLNISHLSSESQSPAKTGKGGSGEKQKLYLNFNKKERHLIDRAFKIVNMREQEKRAGREFKKEVVREQVEKTKDIFFMGITKGLIEREQNRMKAKIGREEQILKNFEKKILEDNFKSKEKFNRKKELADNLEKEANKISNDKNRVVEELKKKSRPNPQPRS